MPSTDEIQSLLKSFDSRVLARGRDYAERGLVTDVREDDDGVHALVEGSETYEVHIGDLSSGGAFVDCTCMAFVREGECKHGAAVVLVMGVESRGGKIREKKKVDALPEILRVVHSANGFLSRLSLYAGERLVSDSDDRYATLSNWWWGSMNRPTGKSAELRRRVLTHAPEIENVFEALRAFQPPKSPGPGTAYAAFYGKLAQTYAAARQRPRIRGALPGPLDERHPGFTFTFDSRQRTLYATENPSPLIPTPLRLGVKVPSDPADDVRLESPSFTNEADAWELFALRAVLIALITKTDAAIEDLWTDLGRPLWDFVLEKLTVKGSAREAPAAREWMFCLTTSYRNIEHKLVAFARPVRPDGRVVKWKKQNFEAVLADESASRLEQDIARVALAAAPAIGKSEPTLMLGTANGHELARLLAAHPRCCLTRSYRADPERATPVEIVAGTLTMVLKGDKDGALAPRFHVGDSEIPFDLKDLHGREGSVFRGAADDDDFDGDRPFRLVSLEVPPPLRPWLDMATRMGDDLVFPREAVPKLTAATQSLSARGMVHLPREALGEELVYEPAAAIRVEWLPMNEEGIAAKVEMLIAVHPRAPFIHAGDGARLFTFDIDDKRVFVERDLDREVKLVTDVIERIDAPIAWFTTTGTTSGVEETVLLGEYLDRNPLGLAIEVKLGRRPQVAQWPSEGANLAVARRGSWLVLDGDLDVAKVKLTLGDVLEAVRHARRYVKATDGVFLELSKETIAKLQPIALATELAPRVGKEAAEGPRLNEAFGSLLAEARTLFGDVRTGGIDLDEYARRFKARDKRIKLPRLDHGTLRPYQRDGVEWMLGLANWAPGCILADDMGLGKTVQTAVALKARAKLGPALVIAPASVSSNWVAELARFMPSLAVRWFNTERDVSIGELGAGDVLIVSYGLLQRELDAFKKARWATVVVDEAQYVKNSGAQRSDAVRSLERDFTIALTGTPLENHLGELFSIVDIAFPGLLGNEGTFRERFRKPIESRPGIRDSERLAALGRLLQPFLLRRTRAAVLQELPPREDITEYIDLSPEETRKYLALRKACEQQLAARKAKDVHTPSQLRIEILAALTRLRQLACDASLVDPTFEGTPTKTARAVELVQQLASEGNRALVFSQFTTFLDKVRIALEQAGLRVGYLTGDIPTTKRRPLIDAFQAGEYDVFCVSLLAGGTGLNLTKASYVIHLDPWWNPAAEEQATSRAHRMGQTDPVTVYRLVARGTIEEAVLEMQANKRELASAVLEGKGDVKVISSDELLNLLRFGTKA
jgi:superfamily II DNA or RNA helicase